MDVRRLIEAAEAARESAYAPYSRFKVGAALLTESGVLYAGCNIENAAFTPGCCAERTAIFKAVSEGERKFAAIAVAGWAENAGPDFAYPCGVCRQVMMEFCEPQTFKIIITAGTKGHKLHTLAELLPCGFGPPDLTRGGQ